MFLYLKKGRSCDDMLLQYQLNDGLCYAVRCIVCTAVLCCANNRSEFILNLHFKKYANLKLI